MDLFGTAGIRGPVGQFLTPALAVAVGQAVAEEATGPEVVVGRDGRISSPALADAVAAGLASGGLRVLRIGAVPTPALAYASRGRTGIMITASHNPPEYNGIKCFADGTEYDADAEARIESRVETETDEAPWDEWASTERVPMLAEYRQFVTGYAEGYGVDPDGLTVAVDCGNGVASLATPQVLAAMGADVRALEATVDGHFPARPSKPTPESLTALRSFVSEIDADFGIAHDGDGDRIVIVDGAGAAVHEDTVLAILAEAYVRAHAADAPVVVTTPNASGRIDDRVTAAGGRTERVRLGALHEGIAATDGPVAFAAEPWKHVHPGLGRWIDGVASAAVLTRLVADAGLAALREPIRARPYRKVSVDCPDSTKDEAMSVIEASLPERFPDASVSTEYGVRCAFEDGSWVLVRASGTEPYLRIYAESDDVDSLVAEGRDAVDAALATVTE